MDNMPNVPMPKLRWSSLSFNVLRELSVQQRPRNLISISVCLFSPLQRPSAALNVLPCCWVGTITLRSGDLPSILQTHFPLLETKPAKKILKDICFFSLLHFNITSSLNWVLAEMLLSLSFAKAILMVLFAVYCSCLLLNCIQTQVGDC